MKAKGDCALIDRELDRLFSPAGTGRNRNPSAPTLDHLRQCERGRRLYAWVLADPPPFEMAPGVVEKLHRQVRTPLSPVVRQPRPPALALRFLAVLALIACSAIGVVGTAGFQVMSTRQQIAMPALFLTGAAVLSLSLAWQMSPGSLHFLPPKSAILGVWAAVMLGFALLFPHIFSLPAAAMGWPCLRTGLLASLPAFAVVWYASRRAGVLSGGASGATAGAVAGVLGATVLQFDCARPDAAHLLVWHGGVLVASAALGLGLAWTMDAVWRR